MSPPASAATDHHHESRQQPSNSPKGKEWRMFLSCHIHFSMKSSRRGERNKGEALQTGERERAEMAVNALVTRRGLWSARKWARKENGVTFYFFLLITRAIPYKEMSRKSKSPRQYK